VFGFIHTPLFISLLPFSILVLSLYQTTLTMSLSSSDVEMIEYKVLDMLHQIMMMW
jgi:hypothetical protein